MSRPLRHMKRPVPQNLAKGGVVIRHPYASGGSVNTNTGGLLGSINGALGTSSGFQAGAAPIQNGVSTDELNNSFQNANGALAYQQSLNGTLLPGATQAANTENALTGQLEGVVNGTGPNAAQTALAQNTSANIAQTAALQAGQRGGAQNVGLLARQAGQQGAATQQQAVGQAGTQQAQQQLSAQQALQTLAANQTGQAQAATGALNTAAQGEQGILQNANAAQNNANVTQQAGINSVNAGVAGANQQQNAGLLGDIGGALGQVGGFAGSLMGGSGSPTAGAGSNSEGAADDVLGDALLAYKGGRISEGPHKSHVANYLYAGGSSKDVPALVSPGEKYLSPDEVKRVMEEGTSYKKLGKKIPGHPKVKGDSIKNDTVPVTLEEGGVVIPRHLMKPGVPKEKVELFIHRSVARKHLPMKESK